MKLNIILALVVVSSFALSVVRSENNSSDLAINKKHYFYKKFHGNNNKLNKTRKSLKPFSFKTINKNTTSGFDPILRKPATLIPNSLSSKDQGTSIFTVTPINKFISINQQTSKQTVLVSNPRSIKVESLSNQCWSSPCLNGARCYGSISTYYCYCSSGYTGNDCEIKTNSQNICGDGKCNSKGKCHINEDKTHSCKCFDSHYGTYCENEKKIKIYQQSVFYRCPRNIFCFMRFFYFSKTA